VETDPIQSARTLFGSFVLYLQRADLLRWCGIVLTVAFASSYYSNFPGYAASGAVVAARSWIYQHVLYPVDDLLLTGGALLSCATYAVLVLWGLFGWLARRVGWYVTDTLRASLAVYLWALPMTWLAIAIMLLREPDWQAVQTFIDALPGWQSFPVYVSMVFYVIALIIRLRRWSLSAVDRLLYQKE
jgi:hypothetical protein